MYVVQQCIEALLKLLFQKVRIKSNNIFYLKDLLPRQLTLPPAQQGKGISANICVSTIQNVQSV